MILRPFSVGSVVQAGGITGIVSSVDLFNTELKTFDGERILLPNQKLTGGEIFNYTHHAIRRIRAGVQVSYDTDLRQARSALLDMAKSHPLVLDDPEPEVWVTALADSGIDLSLRIWVERDDYVEVLREILLLIKERMDKEGIEIPFPQTVVHLQGNSEAAQPPGELSGQG